MKHLSAAISIVLLAAGLSVGCGHHESSPAVAAPDSVAPLALDAAATEPASGKTFEDKSHGFSTTVPDDWKSKSDPQNVLTLDHAKGAELSIAVPKLPMHVPGILPLPAIQSGYVDDVKKRLKDVKVTETQSVKVCGAGAHRFVVTGKDDKIEHKLLAYVIVRGDHVYIVTSEGPADQFDDLVKATGDRVATTWKWLK